MLFQVQQPGKTIQEKTISEQRNERTERTEKVSNLKNGTGEVFQAERTADIETLR